jgi:hypothetical protein
MRRPCLPLVLLPLALCLAGGSAVLRGAEAASGVAVRPPTLPEPPPVPPPASSPVDRFRQLLEMSPAEREAFLAARSPEQREYLRARLAEFDALPAADRELRLHLLNLRHYLLPLLREPAARREELLREVPPKYRELVAERLAAWDRLAPSQQAELLAGGSVFGGLPLHELAAAQTPRAAARQLAPGRREQFQRDLERWEALPESERARITERFAAFLSFSEKEKARVLSELEAPRREQAARLLQALEALSPAERTRSLAALQRLANLPPEQRERFLQNAARWQAMSDEERQAWRRLHALLPPLPPGMEMPPPLPRGAAAPLPPSPPGLTNAARAP